MMTRSQQIFLMGLWTKACREQGWNPRDDAARHRIYAEVLGSAKRFSQFSNADFGKVKARLQMLGGSLRGALEDGHPEIDEARRLRDRIRDYIKCLGVYVDDPEVYLASVLRDKFGTADLDELSAENPAPFTNRQGQLVERPSQLKQVIITLGRIVNGKGGFRAKAGHSMHDMLIAAELPCHCTVCEPGPGMRMSTPHEVNTVLSHQPAETPF